MSCRCGCSTSERGLPNDVIGENVCREGIPARLHSNGDATLQRCLVPLLSEEVDKAAHELRVAQTEFDRQAEVTRLLLEGIGSTHLNHLRCLQDFAEAQTVFYAQCHHHMQDLQRELHRCVNADGIPPPSAAGGSDPASSAFPSEPLTSEAACSSQLPVTGSRKAKVLYDYDAHDASELSLLADELISVYTVPGMDPDWLIGQRGNEKGKVPVTYLELLS